MLFERLGRLVYRRRKAVLALTAAFVAFAAVWGTAVFGVLDGGGFDDPASESSRAVVALEEDLGRAATDVVVVYRAPEGSDLTVDDPRFEAAVTAALGSLPPQDVAAVTSFWSTDGAPMFVSEDRRATYAAIQLAGADEEARDAAYERIADDLVVPGLTTLRGGQVPLFTDVNTQVSEDIAKAESLSIPLLIVLLILVFGSLAAASLPLAVGMVAILGAFTALRGLSLFGDVSIFSVNIVTMLGLGLAIDYSLFVVSRFREELHHGLSVEDAVVRTVATAGRTVAFSGVTVAVALASLLLFPQNFLRSMGAGGIAAVLVAMVAALTMLPALLGVLGTKVDSLKVPLPWNRRRLAGTADPDSGAWARLARGVMRRPVPVMIAVVSVLLVLGAPFLRVAFGGVDSRVLPSGTESRVAAEALQNDFPSSGANNETEVVVRGADDPSGLPAYAAALAAVPGVTSAEVVRSEGGSALVVVTSQGQPQDQASRDLVVDLRQVPGPQGGEVLIGGVAAAQVDLLDGLGSRLPWVGLFLVATMFLLLFLAFGSVVLPIKAMIMNVLSLSATFGILVWGFQDGNLAGPLGFTSTGFLEATQPILIFAMAFGLSMDYEVFLLSRIREEWDVSHDNTQSVARGLQRTGRIITSAALLFVVVVGAFATSGIVFIAMIGVGLTVAVLVDATLVRALLVPATMKLLGRWNWWAPAPMARWWEKHGFREGGEAPTSVSLPDGDDRRELTTVS
ncbi:MAG TPA: MMPL family transporter [Candidatus Limnocylindria bacterium]|nr:MMPL family transporter [Candidatus Limnocylindria bacterium]